MQRQYPVDIELGIDKMTLLIPEFHLSACEQTP